MQISNSAQNPRQKKQEGKGPLGEGMCLVVVFRD